MSIYKMYVEMSSMFENLNLGQAELINSYIPNIKTNRYRSHDLFIFIKYIIYIEYYKLEIIIRRI